MTARPPPLTALLARFRRQQPVRAGSLIITVFGDAIAPRGGAISLQTLIELLAPFGLAERLVRTSVARLAADDWLTSRRIGRLSEYRLSTTGRQRFSEATRRIYAGPATHWSGRWTLILMPGLDAPRRQQIREALRWEGFGEPEPGVLAHPALTPAEARSHLALAGLADGPIVLESIAVDPGADQVLVHEGWDLSELAARYARFIRSFELLAAAPRGATDRTPADAFLVRTLLIHEYRKIHLRDPLLPPSLLPAGWPGTAAYELCRAVYARVCMATELHLGATGARLDGPLPAAHSDLYARFGGLPHH